MIQFLSIFYITLGVFLSGMLFEITGRKINIFKIILFVITSPLIIILMVFIDKYGDLDNSKLAKRLDKFFK